MDILNKRIAALDYGEARIGMAVCDEFHITVNTRPVINNDDRLWETLLSRLAFERVEIVVVGVPRKVDETTTPIIEKIEQFIVELKSRCPYIVVEMDESFSTARAQQIMRESGMKKKRRATKGTKDAVAAAVILTDFLGEYR